MTIKETTESLTLGFLGFEAFSNWLKNAFEPLEKRVDNVEKVAA
jgi:hypothetical protein